MKPGRELNALVATRVMGWQRLAYTPPLPGLPFRPEWFDADGKETGRFAEGEGGDYYVPDEEWEPSERIDHAWEVVRQMHDVHDFWMSLEYEGPEMGSVEFRMTDGPYFRASTSTPTPHAICLAALACVGVMLPGAEQTYPVQV